MWRLGTSAKKESDVKKKTVQHLLLLSFAVVLLMINLDAKLFVERLMLLEVFVVFAIAKKTPKLICLAQINKTPGNYTMQCSREKKLCLRKKYKVMFTSNLYCAFLHKELHAYEIP